MSKAVEELGRKYISIKTRNIDENYSIVRNIDLKAGYRGGSVGSSPTDKTKWNNDIWRNSCNNKD